MEEQDVVVYQIFLQLDDAEEVRPVSSNVKDRLEDLKLQSFGIVGPIAEGYIWQHEPFNLQVCSSLDDILVKGKRLKGSASIEGPENYGYAPEPWAVGTFVPHLAGRVKFGDNLEDEWLVVYLLLEISRRFPTVSITVRDSDGEFLLIESSYFIPKWLSPENSHNRVFLRQGAVHIVPPTLSATSRSRKSCGPSSLKDALEVLNVGSMVTKASPELQNVILDRLAGYPERALKNVHRARCIVPLSVAQVLMHEPQLIALAVESFYCRDMDSMKTASLMKMFSPKDENGSVNLLGMVFSMSRAMYAQLVQQVFQAPHSYPMPPPSATDFIEAEIGMKIAIGFEMMYWERSAFEFFGSEGDGDENVVSSIAELHQKRELSRNIKIPGNDVAWQKYRASLEQRGYFRGLMEDSKDYRELLQTAVTQYRATDLFSRSRKAMHAPAKRIIELLSMPFSASDFPNADAEPGDDDNWRYDGSADLASLMKARQKEMDDYESKQEKHKVRRQSTATSHDDLEDPERFHAEDVVRNMKSFVDKISSFEGAEIPDNVDTNVADGEAINLDMNRLLKELGSVFDAKEISNMLSEGIARDYTDSSSDDLDTSDDNISVGKDEMELDDIDFPHVRSSPSRIEEGNDEGSMFRDLYSDVLDEQLRGSSLAKSFAKQREASPTKYPKISIPESENGQSGSVDKAEQDDDNDNDLVDVDVNLVESLLKSFMFQQGMPGPASNLLGSMSIELPENADKLPESSDKPKR